MKHSIRYISISYSGAGEGQRIQILRGLEIREYRHSFKRLCQLSKLTPDGKWETKYYHREILFGRLYKDN